MPERLTPEQRSRNMSRIRGRDTAVETAVRSGLHRRGLRFRLCSDLPGRPDIVFPRRRIAIFVDGCFWHGCTDHYQKPSNNADYWMSKVSSNRSRDLTVDRKLERMGWRVMRVWEHEVKEDVEATVSRIQEAVAGDERE
jgi:DNA mismatch endonuclease (patch repair protein)